LVDAGATRRQAEAIKRTLGDHAPRARDAQAAEDAAIENAFQTD